MGWALPRSERQQQIVFIERKGVSRKEGAYTHGNICCKKPLEKQPRSWVQETSVKHAARPPLVLQGRGGNRREYTSSVGHSILSEWQGTVVGTFKKIQHLVSLRGKIFCPPCEGAREHTLYLSSKQVYARWPKSIKECIFKKKLHFSGDMLAILSTRIRIFRVLFHELVSSFNNHKYVKSWSVLRDCILSPVKQSGCAVLGSVKADVTCDIKEEEFPHLLVVCP